MFLHQLDEQDYLRHRQSRENRVLERHQQNEDFRFGWSPQLKHHQRHERQDSRRDQKLEQHDLRHHQFSEVRGLRSHNVHH